MTPRGSLYLVRLRISAGHAYTARIRLPRNARPSRRRLAAAARKQAVAAFGEQARRWEFLDSRQVGR